MKPNIEKYKPMVPFTYVLGLLLPYVGGVPDPAWLIVPVSLIALISCYFLGDKFIKDVSAMDEVPVNQFMMPHLVIIAAGAIIFMHLKLYNYLASGPLLRFFDDFGVPTLIKILGFFLITGSFLCGALSTLAMFKNHLPEVELDGEELDHNPTNLFYRPAYLNEKGKRYRMIALISIFVFLASVIARNFL